MYFARQVRQLDESHILTMEEIPGDSHGYTVGQTAWVISQVLQALIARSHARNPDDVS